MVQALTHIVLLNVHTVLDGGPSSRTVDGTKTQSYIMRPILYKQRWDLNPFVGLKSITFLVLVHPSDLLALRDS
jgi:hypothetical protein